MSVNTVISEMGEGGVPLLVGYNTDAMGFEAAISGAIKNAGGRPVASAVCYGYGGVTSVVVAVLRQLGISNIYLTGRRPEEAARRAAELGVRAFSAGKKC